MYATKGEEPKKIAFPITPSILSNHHVTPTHGIDWMHSYYGLAQEPFSSEIQAILAENIKAEDVEIKPDGLLYLPEIKYRRILNRAFGAGGRLVLRYNM